MPSTAAFELWRCCLVFSKGFGVEMLNTIVFKKLFPPQDLAGKGLWDREQPQRAATWGRQGARSVTGSGSYLCSLPF